MSILLRRRAVLLPTVWGWLVILTVGGAAVVVLGGCAGTWLAKTETSIGADGSAASTLVVEGWIDEPDLEQAIAVFRRGRYERVLVTGGPISSWGVVQPWTSFAERGAAYLKAHGLGGVPIDAVPAPKSAQDRTFLSAVVVREWAQRSGVAMRHFDVFTAGVHARRSQRLYEMAFGPEVAVGIIASRPSDFDAARWWQSSAGAKWVMSETVSLAWTACCFWPSAPGPDDEPGTASPP